MPRLTEGTRQERRRRLIDAAWTCAGRKGFRDMTVDDVCTEAGASKGAFYVYFDNKQALLSSLLDEDQTQVEAVMDGLEAEERSPAERIRRFTRWTLDRAAEASRVQLRSDLWAAVVTDEAVREEVSSSIRGRRERLRRWIEEGVESEELVDVPANALASMLLALQEGLLLHASLDPTGFRWRRVQRAVDLILSGVRRA